MRFLLALLSMFMLLCIGAHNAAAAIVQASASIHLVAAPSSVEPGAVMNSTYGIAFDEQQGISYALYGIKYDISGVPGWYNDPSDFNGSFIPATMTVDSHFIHLEPTEGSLIVQSVVEFDHRILGIAVLSSRLNTSDNQFGLATTQYPSNTASNRGMELDISSGGINIRPDGRSLFISRVAEEIDQIRVITMATDVAGDYNGDGEVSSKDIEMWERFYGGSDMLAADGNMNFVVDGGDLLEWQRNSVVTSTIATVPEPSSVALLSLVILGLISCRVW